MKLSKEIYGSWKEKQLEKYRNMLEVPEVRQVFQESEDVLDIGIGKSWIWSFLEENGYSFEEIIGVDVDKEATEPEKENVDYIYSKNPEIDREFDLVLAFDSIHLINYGDRLPVFVKNGGFILQSVPLKFEEEIKKYRCTKTIEERIVGEKEEDALNLQKKNNGG